MATLSSTHEHDRTVSSSIPLEVAEPPRRVKGVKTVPMYHPRLGYLHILAYAACNVVSPLPTKGSAISSDSEAHSVATPSPPTNWVSLPPLTGHKEKSPNLHRSISEPDGVLAPVSTSTPAALNTRRLRSRPLVRSPHPYKDSSYTLRSSKKTRPDVDISQTESPKYQARRAVRQNEANPNASRRPKRRE